MNDLDLVRELRADVPAPSPAQVAAGRDRLLAATAVPVPRVRRPRRVFLPVGIGAIALGAAAAVAVTVVASGAHPSSNPNAAGQSPRPVSSQPVSPHQVTGAQVLTLAANKLASEQVTRPAASKWVYQKFFQTQAGVATQLTESWERFDGTKTAYLTNGKPVIHDVTVKAYNTPLDAYNAMAALPSSPAAIRATADRVLGTTPASWLNWAEGNPVADVAPKTQGQAEFDYLAEMLWLAYAAAPADAEAHVYRAMAAIPGVTVNTHATTAVGQPAIGVTADGGKSLLLLDPRTYQVIGLRVKPTPFMKKAASGPQPPSGTISMAYEKVALVNRAGDR